MLINYLFIALSGFSFGVLFIWILNNYIRRRKVLISQNIPLVGGIGMGLSFIFVSLISFLLQYGLSRQVMGIVISATIMLVFGIIDDWRELSIAAKLFVQVIATSFLILFGIKTEIVYIGNLLNIIITFIWVLGITNAFNHLDIIDGLAGGTALIVSLAFFAISLLSGDVKTIILTLALSGSILSFLIRNFPPAKIYMGNSGSHFLGFILAAIALVISYAPLERKVALLTPLLILGFPIFDSALLVLMRISNGRSAFKKSNDHLALKLLRIRYSKKMALFLLLALCLFFSLCGLVVSQVPNPLGITVVTFVILVSLVLTKKISNIKIDG